jgi:hypothetical protein
LGLLPAANVIVIHPAVVPPITFSKRLSTELSEISAAGLMLSRFGTFVSLILTTFDIEKLIIASLPMQPLLTSKFY